MKPHPDRRAPTLAARTLLPAEALTGPFAPPGAGSADVRMDLKLLAWRVQRALQTRGTDAARARLAELTSADLWAGTVQDGTARGFMVALEEALSLCAPESGPGPEPEPPPAVADKQLRRRRDFLVASAGARLRFSRKGGVVLVDRQHDVHAENCIVFDDRADDGTLDGFVPREGERPRLFSPSFLTPLVHDQNDSRDLLVLEGRLGRRADGYPCRLRFEGRRSESFLRLSIAVRNTHTDHRLRIRFLGFDDPAHITHRAPPSFEIVRTSEGRRFVAATLVRACGRLLVGDEVVATPAAQCLQLIGHEFLIGGDAGDRT